MEVAHVRWPSEGNRRERLRRQRRPRLLLLDEGTPPPDEVDDLEDWIRLPADELDVKARSEHLVVRSRRQLTVTPSLDAGVLRVGDEWVSLSPLEARLTAVLLERIGVVVSRDTLARTGWPAGTNARNTLDVHVARLRRRLGSVGLAIHTVRSRGYLLELSGFCEQDVHQA
jgi:DNA-binding response OmpR family regulator